MHFPVPGGNHRIAEDDDDDAIGPFSGNDGGKTEKIARYCVAENAHGHGIVLSISRGRNVAT